MVLAIEQIRFGGPMHHENQAYSDAIADILPPPLYVIEPYLEANRILLDPASAAERLDRLEKLEADYRARVTFWTKAGLPDALRGPVLEKVTSSGDAIWKEVDGPFAQAVRGGDALAARDSGARIDSLYDAHRSAVDAFVLAATDGQKALGDSSRTTLWAVLIGLFALGAGVLGAVMWLLRFLDREVLAPVEEIADAMGSMAQGNTDVTIPGAGRQDEIGTMARTADEFLGALSARVGHEEQQQAVVQQLAYAMEQLAQGNLLHRITANFAAHYATLRTSYNAALDSLADTLRQAGEAANSVSSGAREIRAASDDLAMRTEKQAARLESASSALTAVTSSIGETARDAGDAAAAINLACEASQEGGNVVRSAIEAMGEIERSSREISSIIEVIDGIAFQTNLLALNAGVEAARAGDAGKGFAVVANEVRALSQRSSDAASQIRQLIGGSSQHVASGVSLVNSTGSVLEGISVRVSEVAGRLSAISEAASDQAGRVREISGVVSEMDRTTQQNAAMVEETTAAARSLSGEADRLRGHIAGFRAAEDQAPMRLAS